MFRLQVPRLLALLYTHNPFYLVSAALFVCGLKLEFRPDHATVFFEAGSVAYIDPWNLMLSLCGVTAVMAVTAFLIVRLGQVWDDARSLVLVLLLMFVAISVSLDEIVTLSSLDGGDPGAAVELTLLGLGFSLVLCESLLRGLQIRLPAGFRIPLYGLLSLFFLFPLWLSPEMSAVTIEQARWRVASFSTAAALITLLLLPAVRRGSVHVQDNGTPWSWPWFPWTLFGAMGFAVCFRAWSLAISFDLASAHHEFWGTSFGLYFLMPLVLAALIVLLEVGIVENLPKLKNGVMLAAPLLVPLSYPWLGPWASQYTYRQFAYEVVDVVGSPVYLALMSLIAFYAVARVRRVRYAEAGLIATLLAAVFVSRDSFGATVHDPQLAMLHAWPLAVISLVELGTAFVTRRSINALIGCLALALAVGLMLPEAMPFRFNVTVHLIMLAVLITGSLFHDDFARHLRRLAAVLLTAAGIVAVVSQSSIGLTFAAMPAYASLLATVALVTGWLLRERFLLLAAGINLVAGGILTARWGSHVAAAIVVSPGAKLLSWAVLSFAAAVLISTLKGGLGQRLVRRYFDHTASARVTVPHDDVTGSDG